MSRLSVASRRPWPATVTREKVRGWEDEHLHRGPLHPYELLWGWGRGGGEVRGQRSRRSRREKEDEDEKDAAGVVVVVVIVVVVSVTFHVLPRCTLQLYA